MLAVGPRYSSHSRFGQSPLLQQSIFAGMDRYLESPKALKSGCSSNPEIGTLHPVWQHSWDTNCGVPQYSTDLTTQNPRNPRLSLAALQNRLAPTDLQGFVEVWRSELHESRTSRAFAGCGTLKKYEKIPFEIDKNLAKIECFW